MSTINPDDRSIILASASPRRLALCERIGFEPIVEVSDIAEARDPSEMPADYTRRLAREKASDVARRLDGEPGPEWILAADTIVVLEHDVLEKPVDEDDASIMLHRLSGREHTVVTSYCWYRRSDGDFRVESVEAKVLFRELSDDVIDRYVATGEPLDKAGGYGIQDLGGVFVERIEGSYFAVVGLPIAEVVATLEELGGLEGFPFPKKND